MKVGDLFVSLKDTPIQCRRHNNETAVVINSIVLYVGTFKNVKTQKLYDSFLSQDGLLLLSCEQFEQTFKNVSLPSID